MKQMIRNENAFVVTGGPGVGKTKVLEELSYRGFGHVPEVARAIIREEVAHGGNALPGGDTATYTAKMLKGTVRVFEENLHRDAPFFFDRGLPDVLAYAQLVGLRETDEIESACRRLRYNQAVFIAPPWEQIYVTDSERKQSFVEAVATFEVIARVYEELGYRLIELPRVSVRERAEIIGDVLQK